jgi:hypothetical protein
MPAWRPRPDFTMTAFYLIGPDSFQSVWYWILTLLVWTQVTHRTLGVPYDMILRARRLPEMVQRVECLALVSVARITGIYRTAGTIVAAATGFALAVLFVIGFLLGMQFARAAFVLAAPLCIIGYSSLRVALSIDGRGFRGETLVRILARRRFWHQVIAVISMLAALAVASASEPRLFGT